MLHGSETTDVVISAAIEVHRQLGPGLLEEIYEECLAYELCDRGVNVERQVDVPVVYKGARLFKRYRIDMLVDNQVIIELKSVRKLEPIHKAQLLTYLRLTGNRIGLLLNFNVPVLKQGIIRLINGYE